MTNILKYLDYQGSVEVDLERDEIRGKLLFVTDLVTYVAATPGALQAAFEDAVDDYLATCESLGRAPQKAFSGAFNVRISPEAHRALAVISACDNSTLNSVVTSAIGLFIEARNGKPNEVHHAHRHVIESRDMSLPAFKATMSGHLTWEAVNVATH